MYKRYIALLLALCMLCSALPSVGAVFAQTYEDIAPTTYETATPTTYATDSPSAQTRVSGMRFSENGVNFLKVHEGFTKYATWDYAQWSIGYGSGCNPDDYPNGITEQEADRLLREYVITFENVVNNYMRNNDISFNQHQFDAMVIFSYGCGSAWTSGCKITRWLKNPTTELDFVNAMGAWCHAGGDVLEGLVRRRTLEAKIFLYGDYTGNQSPNYTAVCFRGNGGTIVNEDSDHIVRYYKANQAYGSFPAVEYPGNALIGWYDQKTGEQISTSNIAGNYRTVNAKWEKAVLGFTDISSSAWYYSSVKAMVERKLFSGTSATTFSPNGTMTRAMLVSVLHRLEGSPISSAAVPFDDVESGRWYANSIAWGAENNIVSGITQTAFAPNAPVTREQAVTILYRYAAYKKYDLSESTSLQSYPDADAVSTYAVPAFQWATAMGIISGVKSNNQVTLQPAGHATRAQAATILASFIRSYQL